ncbi:MAG: hypothetical protein HYX39_08560 [Bacteroidetes bacterium]|nr:hypothetical protein [Bacteroidota bacterium]
MKTEKKENIASYRIPADILMDVLRILFANKIKHRIEGIKEKENIALFQMNYPDTKIGIGAQDNIESILQDYSEYMEGLLGNNELIVYSENEDEDN